MNIENRKDKKELRYTKVDDALQLMIGLFEAIPTLKPENKRGKARINLRVFTRGDELILWVPGDVDETLVETVVEKHKIVNVDEGQVKMNAVPTAES